MKKYYFNKLIRSKLPARMSNEGINIIGRNLNGQEFAKALKNKLVEEAMEVQEADSIDNVMKELADVMEVIKSIFRAHNISEEDVEKERIAKAEANGVFLPVNFVDYIKVPLDNKEVIEYMEDKNRPYKYSDVNDKVMS